MSKKVLVVSTSLRSGGNSDIMADTFIEVAKEVGHDVTKITLANKNIGFCKGCLVCQNSKPCVIKDDANDIVEKIKEAEVIVFATPVYFYDMCGQMKTLLDRTNPLFVADYKFRDIYLLAAAADDEAGAMDGTVKGLEGWISCFDKCSLKGVIKGLGIDRYGAINEHHEILEQVSKLAKSI